MSSRLQTIYPSVCFNKMVHLDTLHGPLIFHGQRYVRFRCIDYILSGIPLPIAIHHFTRNPLKAIPDNRATAYQETLLSLASYNSKSSCFTPSYLRNWFFGDFKVIPRPIEQSHYRYQTDIMLLCQSPAKSEPCLSLSVSISVKVPFHFTMEHKLTAPQLL